MDLLTHAVLGATGAAAMTRTPARRTAALVGGMAGVAPDADILIASAADPLLNLEFHRHFTHALVLGPVGALLIAGLVWLIVRRRTPYAPLYGAACIGYLLSPLLDACTSYGTHLWWPFAAQPIAWSIIAVIDPVFTLLVLVPLIVCLWRQQRGWAQLGAALAACYLVLGGLQHARAVSAARELAVSRQHHVERFLVKPTLGNLVLWRSVYIHEGRVYVDAIRTGLMGGTRLYPGESAPLFDPQRDLMFPVSAVQRRDVERFIAFTGGYPVRHPRRAEMIGDARYAMLPTRIEPIWGIVPNAASPEAHVRFETDRTFTPEIRTRFLDMLRGREVAPR